MYSLVQLKSLWKNKILNTDENLEILDTNGENYLGYYDNYNDYERDYYYPDTESSLKKRIMMDKEASLLFSKQSISKFLNSYIDENSLMVLNRIIFVWDDDIHGSSVRNELENEFYDEYAQEIGFDLLGQTWTDRQIIVINLKKLLESSIQIANESDEWLSVAEIFTNGLCQTIFHECRHLFYECNELISIGEGTPYPQDGGIEDEVEEYGNTQADIHNVDFKNCLSKNINSNIEKLSSLIKDSEIER